MIKYWGAWLDPTHPHPAKDGELRWYTTIGGADREVDGPGPHLVDGAWVRARSRSFIRSRLADNPDLADNDYDAVWRRCRRNCGRPIATGASISPGRTTTGR